MRIPSAITAAFFLILGTAVTSPPALATPPSSFVPVKNQLNPASCAMGFAASPSMFDPNERTASYVCTDNYEESGGCDGGLTAEWVSAPAHAYTVNGVVTMNYSCWSSQHAGESNSGLKCGNQPAFSKLADGYGGYECASIPLTCSAPLVAYVTKAQQIPDVFQYTCRQAGFRPPKF